MQLKHLVTFALSILGSFALEGMIFEANAQDLLKAENLTAEDQENPQPLSDEDVPSMFFVDPTQEELDGADETEQLGVAQDLDVDSIETVSDLVHESTGVSNNFYYFLSDGSRVQPMWAKANQFFGDVNARGLQAERQQRTLSKVQFYDGTQYIVGRSSYDYAPSVMFDSGKYKMWWCGGYAGDAVFYAETTGVDPNNIFQYWTQPTVVFRGRYADSGTPEQTIQDCALTSSFDCAHTCDPSVVKVGGMYFMYYGGINLSYGYQARTRIGVAQSTDGINWTRINSGNPIVLPWDNSEVQWSYTDDADVNSNGNTTEQLLYGQYGAGQPSVVYVDGLFYMTFSDDTVNNSYMDGVTTTSGYISAYNNNFRLGQYALRSPDPTFQTNLEELRADGWYHITASQQRSGYRYVENTVNADWSYFDYTDDSGRQGEFIISINGLANYTSVRFFNKGLTEQVENVLHVAANWVEGPGIARYGNGQMLKSSNCDALWFHVVMPEGNGTDNSTWDLSHTGWSRSTNLSECYSSSVRTVADDYDDDGISDPVVWRPSTGVWWIKLSSSIDYDSNGTIDSLESRGEQWGLVGDMPIFGADYDGDLVADLAVKRSSSGSADYYVMPSSGMCPSPFQPYVGTKGCSYHTTAVPSSTDTPLPIDYDGDGKTDIAAWVMNGSYSQLRVIPSSGTCPPSYNYQTTWDGVTGCYYQWSWYYDKPLAADYDGDGRSDYAFVRPTTTPPQIWVLPSNGTPCPRHFATQGAACYSNLLASGDIPLTGDYDGDGATDIAWWAPGSPYGKIRTWGVSSSDSGCPYYFSYDGSCWMWWGNTGDIPLAKDFNGDGKTDPTSYLADSTIPSQGVWAIRGSNALSAVGSFWTPTVQNCFETRWGLTTDRVEGLR